MTMLFSGWRHPEYVEEQLKVHSFEDIEVVVSPNLITIENPAACAERTTGILLQIISTKREIWSVSVEEAFD
jgi:hypothetical protein